MENIHGNVGFIYPTFEEYPNSLPEKRRVIFIPDNENFTYSADDVITYFGDKDIGAVIIVNPDNPSGNFIRENDIIKLLEWSSLKNIKIIIDESFIDFSDDYPFTLIDGNILDKYKNLVVVKSISKSYGIPGLRLGVLASSDKALIESIKKDISIWNINSIAEFYMQIEEKYNSDYEYSLEVLRKTRQKFISHLSETGMLRAIPSQANFITAEILGGMTARELTKKLLLKHNIFIKDLSEKPAFAGKQYVRIAVKAEEDNNKLILALKEISNN
jgi:histidinol-phosphate/aromatic aminotransferase/cobyric acid decarboxylase-like protein